MNAPEHEDPMRLAEEVCERFRALGFEAEVGGSDHVNLSGTPLGDARVNLANLASMVRDAESEEERTAEIDRFVKALQPSDERKLVTLVRSAAYLEELKDAELNPNQIQLIAGDLYAVMAWDEGPRISTYTISDEELGEDPFAIGSEGVLSSCGPVEMHGDHFKMITCGGDYESCLLLADIWDFVAEHVDGDVIAAVPARDLLFVTGANDAEGLTLMEAAIRRVFDEGMPHPISRAMLRRTGEAWALERDVT